MKRLALFLCSAVLLSGCAYEYGGYGYNGYYSGGYDSYGYDRFGFDRYGYDRYGYDRTGYTRDGLDRKGHYRSYRTGDPNRGDRRLELQSAPTFGIVGEPMRVTGRVIDANGAASVRLNVSIDGERVSQTVVRANRTFAVNVTPFIPSGSQMRERTRLSHFSPVRFSMARPAATNGMPSPSE